MKELKTRLHRQIVLKHKRFFSELEKFISQHRAEPVYVKIKNSNKK